MGLVRLCPGAERRAGRQAPRSPVTSTPSLAGVERDTAISPRPTPQYRGRLSRLLHSGAAPSQETQLSTLDVKLLSMLTFILDAILDRVERAFGSRCHISCSTMGGYTIL